MQYKEILHRCFRCGYCKLPSDYSDINCPSYLKYGFESFSPGGRMWLIRAWLDLQIQNSPRLQEIFFSCATCNNCVENCPFSKFKDQILKAFISAKEEMVNQGTVPASVRDYLTILYEHDNPYKISQKKRRDWAEGLQVPDYAGQEFLFYVGDVGSFDSRGREIACSVANLLKHLNISFGILGSKEGPDGNEANALGETELFEYLAKKNIQTFNQHGVTKVITLSPHSYNTFKNEYPELGSSFQVFHYTQILASHLSQTSLAGQQEPGLTKRITFHDPCYLGRHNQDYQSPRDILHLLPSLELTEMRRNRSNALCCGGGGGNFFTDLVCSGPETSAKVRAKEADEIGAEILVTCCPICTIILEDAVKSQGLDQQIQVKEISELILDKRR
ncbi:MAG TPA: (Fe-S)-binding protein [Desulfohalobiaceae bacterium]|nr:(Fe-S)-binding protein [Desulfohalobiaceae bacterium]